MYIVRFDRDRRGPSLLRAAVVATVGVALAGAPAGGAEVGSSSRYYEDDAWYDVTEWLDGNDYNPTDEAWWRWDDEAYQASKDVGGDRDDDRSAWYGYRSGNDNDWFYDYYDPDAYSTSYPGDTNFNGIDRYGVNYYDYDADGAYDASMSFIDWDGNGLYDEYRYFAYSDSADSGKQRQARDAAPTESRRQSVTGQIEKTKEVHVRGGEKHLVLQIEPLKRESQQSSQGTSLVVDLGPVDAVEDLNLRQGENLTVSGHRAKVGDQSVLLATSVKAKDPARQIDRAGRNIEGKVLSTHKAKVRGTEHLMAIVDAKREGSDQGSKVAVDLGPANKLQVDVSKGSTLTFTGLPVKVKDRRLVIAQSVKKGDQFVSIDRQPGRQAGDEARTAGATSGGESDPKSSSNASDSSQQQQQKK